MKQPLKPYPLIYSQGFRETNRKCECGHLIRHHAISWEYDECRICDCLKVTNITLEDI